MKRHPGPPMTGKDMGKGNGEGQGALNTLWTLKLTLRANKRLRKSKVVVTSHLGKPNCQQAWWRRSQDALTPCFPLTMRPLCANLRPKGQPTNLRSNNTNSHCQQSNSCCQLPANPGRQDVHPGTPSLAHARS